MKTLVFSPRVVLDGMPAGFSGTFKMLHTETGQLYVYRVHIPKHIYVGSHISGGGSTADDLKWWQRMFHALTIFLADYNAAYGHLPTDRNIYQDRRPYTSDREPLGKKIHFFVDQGRYRSLSDRELILYEAADESALPLDSSGISRTCAGSGS